MRMTIIQRDKCAGDEAQQCIARLPTKVDRCGENRSRAADRRHKIAANRCIQIADSGYVYAQTGEGHLWVKRCQRSSKTKLITIRSDNPLYASETGIGDDDIKVIGRVIWVGRHIGG